MKSVLISIQPKWCELIASGKKTVEVRKTKPNLATPFKCYIYCTKGFKPNTPYSYKTWAGYGKVIGEFVCNDIECFTSDYRANGIQTNKMISKSCMGIVKLMAYESKHHCLYGWHISDLIIYDKPKELSKFKKINRECWYADLGLAKRDCHECKNKGCFVTRPPQSWCYVEALR